jgi:hypothetical protein
MMQLLPLALAEPLCMPPRRYWLTGNTCNPGPCNPADPAFPNCDRQLMGYCGTRQHSYPEEFWNCADIQIRRPAMTG